MENDPHVAREVLERWNETPRERQVREELELLDRTRLDSERHRRRVAKCKLVGHRWLPEDMGWCTCDRCGQVIEPEYAT